MKLGVTLGDPTGVGPEITAAALAELTKEQLARIVVFGDRGPLERGARAMRVALPNVEVIASGVGDKAELGKPDDASGAAQVAYLEAAVAADGIAALATAPISKTWCKRAGFAFADHTTFLAARYRAPHVVMMFAGPKLKVALATIHVPLARVPHVLEAAEIGKTIQLVHDSLVRDHGIARPRIGVVGLNPHAGENGLLGDEDTRIIAPAVEAHRHIGASGPIVPDAAFRAHLDGRYDALVAMYHDQGLIPVKLVDFEESVNVTLGLPIARTSPDHGTAHDIAGTGVARATSMKCAIRLAFEMMDRRRALSPRA